LERKSVERRKIRGFRKSNGGEPKAYRFAFFGCIMGEISLGKRPAWATSVKRGKVGEGMKRQW